MAGGHGGDKAEANLDVILGTAGWIDKTADDFRNDVDTLMRDVRRLMEHWQCSTAETHADAWSDWYNSADNLVGALADDANALRAAARAYAHIDGTTANNVGNAVDGLGPGLIV